MKNRTILYAAMLAVLAALVLASAVAIAEEDDDDGGSKLAKPKPLPSAYRRCGPHHDRRLLTSDA